MRLTDERWAHVLEHPEMVGLEEDVCGAIRDPDLIVVSRADPEVRLVYRFLPMTRVGPKFVVVVVKVKPDDAFVVTAYLTEKPMAGRELWKKGQ